MRRHRRRNRWARGSWHSRGPGVRSRGKSRRDGDSICHHSHPPKPPTRPSAAKEHSSGCAARRATAPRRSSPRRSASPAPPTLATSAPATAPTAASRCRRRGRSRTSWAAPSTSSSAARTSTRPSPRESSPATTPSAPRAAPSWTATSPTWSSASAPPAPREGGERHGQGREEPQRCLLLPHGRLRERGPRRRPRRRPGRGPAPRRALAARARSRPRVALPPALRCSRGR